MSSLESRSLFRIGDFSFDEIRLVFSRAELFKSQFSKIGRFDDLLVKPHDGAIIMGLVFLEPSTRTRLSFQMAARRMGLGSARLDGLESSSRSKGEGDVDTIETVAAMLPNFLVVRYGGSPLIQSCLEELSCPVINAGSGSAGHPTQALLDGFTIRERRGKIKGERVLFVGDVLHSRVANSNLTLLKSFGAEVAVCSPKHLMPTNPDWEQVKYFSNLDEGMAWSTVCMALRIQKERHEDGELGLGIDQYIKDYRVDLNRLEHLVSDGIIMNPGPFVHDVELTSDVLSDSRCCVREQVTNGMFIRASLISHVCGFKVRGEDV